MLRSPPLDVLGSDTTLRTQWTRLGVGAVALTIGALLGALTANAQGPPVLASAASPSCTAPAPPDTVFVRKLGAVGNGVHDDTEALEQAIRRGGLVVVPAGKFLVLRPLVGGSSLRLQGAGPDVSVIVYRREHSVSDRGIDQEAGVSLLSFPDGSASIAICGIALTQQSKKQPAESYGGRVAGLRFGSVQGVLIEHVDISGFNHSGIFIRPFSSDTPARHLRVVASRLHGNRVAGLWISYAVDVHVEGNDLFENGAAGDIGTGYGVAGSYYRTPDQRPSQVVVTNNRVFFNRRNGVDFHTGHDLTIRGNRLWARTDQNGIGDQLRHIYLGEVSGLIDISENVMIGARDRALGNSQMIAGISVGYPSQAAITRPVRIIIDGNVIEDFDVANSAEIGVGILSDHDDFAQASWTITNNVIRARHIGSFVRMNGGTVTRETLNAVRISGNRFLAESVGYHAIHVDNVTSLTADSNAIAFEFGGNNADGAIVAQGVTHGPTLDDRIHVYGNAVRGPSTWRNARIVHPNYNVCGAGNVISGAADSLPPCPAPPPSPVRAKQELTGHFGVSAPTPKGKHRELGSAHE